MTRIVSRASISLVAALVLLPEVTIAQLVDLYWGDLGVDPYGYAEKHSELYSVVQPCPCGPAAGELPYSKTANLNSEGFGDINFEATATWDLVAHETERVAQFTFINTLTASATVPDSEPEGYAEAGAYIDNWFISFLINEPVLYSGNVSLVGSAGSANFGDFLSPGNYELPWDFRPANRSVHVSAGPGEHEFATVTNIFDFRFAVAPDPQSVPEIDSAGMPLAITLLAGIVAVLRERRRTLRPR